MSILTAEINNLDEFIYAGIKDVSVFIPKNIDFDIYALTSKNTTGLLKVNDPSLIHTERISYDYASWCYIDQHGLILQQFEEQEDIYPVWIHLTDIPKYLNYDVIGEKASLLIDKLLWDMSYGSLLTSSFALGFLFKRVNKLSTQNPKSISKECKDIKSPKGFIYVIHLVENTYKVGFSTSPESRLNQFKTVLPQAKILCTFPHQTIQQEKTLHKELGKMYTRVSEVYEIKDKKQFMSSIVNILKPNQQKL